MKSIAPIILLLTIIITPPPLSAQGFAPAPPSEFLERLVSYQDEGGLRDHPTMTVRTIVRSLVRHLVGRMTGSETIVMERYEWKTDGDRWIWFFQAAEEDGRDRGLFTVVFSPQAEHHAVVESVNLLTADGVAALTPKEFVEGLARSQKYLEFQPPTAPGSPEGKN